MPKISVLMPVYNAEEFLDESISSILNQTFTDFVLLILDDASQDKSLSIIRDYEKKDKRIKVFRNKVNKKANISRNILLDVVQTEYFAWMDADDISLEKRLQIQYDFLQNNSDVGIVGGESRCQGWERPKNDFRIKSMLFLVTNPFINTSVMVRTKIIKEHTIQFRPYLYSAHDYQFWVDCMPFAKFINLDDELVFYRHHPNQMSKQYNSQQKEFHLQILQEQLQKFGISISTDLLAITVQKSDEKLTLQKLIQIKDQYFKPILNIRNFYNYSRVSKNEIARIFVSLCNKNLPYSLIFLAKLFWKDKKFFSIIIVECLKVILVKGYKKIRKKLIR